jgi:esterase/lipase superfamily enzyme
VVGFSGERNATAHYGWCHIAIPESHKIGSIGSPWWKRLLTRKDDRLKLVKLRVLTDSEYWTDVANALRKVSPADRDAVVFLHGYNVSFEQAALRAAQLGCDLGIAGVMAFYSWPSKGTLQGYSADEASIEASEGLITDYLVAMARKSGAAKVHIIAHSMGNRALLRAIDRISLRAGERADVCFDQIILAAADVDQDSFRRLSVAYQRVATRTTMYVCAKDRAAEASRWLHEYPRAGLTPPVLIVPGIDTVSVSNLDLTLLGHGYVAEARELLTDIHALLQHGAAPKDRFGLRKQLGPGGEYWAVGR